MNDFNYARFSSAVDYVSLVSLFIFFIISGVLLVECGEVRSMYVKLLASATLTEEIARPFIVPFIF